MKEAVTMPANDDDDAQAVARSAATVRDPAAARLLADGRTGLYLGCFLQRETSVAEAAERFGIAPARMAYWVKKMQALGLVRPAGKSAATGSRSQMRYTATAPAFCVPRASVGVALWRDMAELHTRQAWNKVIDSSLHSQRDAARACLWLYRRASDGSVWRIFGPAPAMTADDGVLVNYGLLLLVPQDYRALQDELNRTIARYHRLSCEPRSQSAQRLKVWYTVAANELAA
jgi:transposase-like protein